MVGVPTSKGCNTCRQRKIACGLERPECLQCVKSNRFCAGYHRDRKFIVSEGVIRDGKAKALASHTRQIQVHQSRSASTTLICRNAIASAPTSSVSHGPAYRQQMLSAFLNSQVCMSEVGPEEERPWFLSVPGLPSPTPALNTAFLALSTAKVGRLNNDIALVEQSHRIYIQGLRELSKALQPSSSLLHDDQTLGACLALSLYEILECPSDDRLGYISHQDGCSRLVQMRGPQAHRSGLGHKIFRHFRIQEILNSLDRHKKTFLTDREWMVLPWEESRQGPFDRIVSFLAVAPGIFERGDALAGLPGPIAMREAADMLDHCWKLDALLQEFYAELEASHPGPLYWPQFSNRDNPADDPELGKVFPVAFHFSNLKMAQTLIMYWAVLLMLYQGLNDLHGLVYMLKQQLGSPITPVDSNNVSLEEVETSTTSDGSRTGDTGQQASQSGTPTTGLDWNNLPPLEHRVDILSIARNICQSVEYCMQDHMLGSGPAMVVAPLNIVLATLKSRPDFQREIYWAAAVVDEVRRKGMRILSVLKVT